LTTMKDLEKRTINIELRAGKEGRTIEGYAAIYNEETELWGFREMIETGAFDNANVSDVRALFNHNPDMILARTSSGTLTVETDDKGLKYSFEAPNTTLGNDLLEMVRRGDISQSSFAFTIEAQQWEERDGDDMPLRRITEVRDVFDVSPVTYPAYEKTTATARSLEKFLEERRGPENEEDDEIEIYKEQLYAYEAEQ